MKDKSRIIWLVGLSIIILGVVSGFGFMFWAMDNVVNGIYFDQSLMGVFGAFPWLVMGIGVIIAFLGIAEEAKA